MAETNLVVVRYLSGKCVKGSTQDFFPERISFHVQTRTETTQVKMAELKAVFFVRDLNGNAQHIKSRKFGVQAPSMASAKKIAVLFKDQELLVGYTNSYVAGKLGFFLTPADERGNNIRVYVLSHAAKAVRAGAAADELVATAPQPKPRPRKAA
jgi:uncharacterized protein DUF6982